MTTDDALESTTAAIEPALGELVLDLRGVRKRFRSGRRVVEALRGVTLRARRGRVTGLIGPDGSGKTTLMRLIAGLLSPDAGEIEVLGRTLSGAASAPPGSISYMPQRFGLYEDLTVAENLELYADLQGVPSARRAGRYLELTRLTGLGRFTGRAAGRLSGGMKQKLGLACTLVRAPELLLLDEPTVGVDPLSRRELWSIVNRLVRDEGVSVFVSTLYLDEAEHCDDVVILYDGEAPAQAAPRAFSERVRGRSWVVSGASGGVRAAQARLSRCAGVIDSVIQADGVRLVAAEGVVFEAETLLAGLPGATLTAVEPRFEDAFMAIVHERAPASVTSRGASAPVAVRGDRVAAGAVIEVANVQRRFGDFYAVKGVTFEVARGEVFGLLGANGAGKSTTFRMLCGLLPPSAGRLRVAGVDVRRAAAAARAKIGYMSQKFSLYGYLSVRQNMAFFSAAYGLSGRRRDERIAWALDQFQLADSADARAADLALGFKQRLALACALMHEPDILFLDEPTSGVDPPARREFWRRINDLAEQRVTVLVTTHFLEEAEYCDRLAVMADGEILALGTPAEVKSLAGPRDDRPRSMEEAFIALIEQRAAASAGGTS